MQLKLDENLGNRGQALIRDAGYGVSTVSLQEMEGAIDEVLIEVCRVEARVLVTLDLDFANPIHYPPNKYAGIIVLRPPKEPGYEDILECIRAMLRGLDQADSMLGKLWIVSKTQIREYAPAQECPPPAIRH